VRLSPADVAQRGGSVDVTRDKAAIEAISPRFPHSIPTDPAATAGRKAEFPENTDLRDRLYLVSEMKQRNMLWDNVLGMIVARNLLSFTGANLMV
jgi:hypothetical protein